MNKDIKTSISACRFANNPRRQGVAGRVPLPGSALANHTFDGFGSKCFVKVTEDQETESEEMRDYFPDEENEEEK